MRRIVPTRRRAIHDSGDAVHHEPAPVVIRIVNASVFDLRKLDAHQNITYKTSKSLSEMIARSAKKVDVAAAFQQFLL